MFLGIFIDLLSSLQQKAKFLVVRCSQTIKNNKGVCCASLSTSIESQFYFKILGCSTIHMNYRVPPLDLYPEKYSTINGYAKRMECNLSARELDKCMIHLVNRLGEERVAHTISF